METKVIDSDTCPSWINQKWRRSINHFDGRQIMTERDSCLDTKKAGKWKESAAFTFSLQRKREKTGG